MKPSVSRMVHYVSYGTPGGEFASTCRAAVVAEVHDATLGIVSLCVLNPTGIFFHDCVYDPVTDPAGIYKGGTWHWPERVDE